MTHYDIYKVGEYYVIQLVEAHPGTGPKATTHRAECPLCRRRTWIKFLPSGEVNLRESCSHVSAIVRSRGNVEVEFSYGGSK